MRVQVGIVGAGPAGLLLSQLLDLQGIETVVVERRSQEYVLGRIRAGVLERGTVEIVRRACAGARMDAESLIHRGVEICAGGLRRRIDFGARTGGSLTVYGQTELIRDLVDAREARGGALVYEAEDVGVAELDSDRPTLSYLADGRRHRIDCDFIAGCDGFHGVCRRSIPPARLTTYEREYPFGWLGILSETRPVSDELIYASHDRGFALCSMRSMTRSRCYVQCEPDDDPAAWSDDRFWDELRRRLPPDLAARLETGPSIEKSVARLRSFVCEPMRHGRLFLAGDAAHIVPPTGAKGLNLAVADVHYLSEALIDYYRRGRSQRLDAYSTTCLARIWKAERFSAWLTSLLHRYPGRSDFDRRLQLAELDYLADSEAAQTAFSENYVGLPLTESSD
jgi:p-hydroxybenzoate 3-monooxygenase